MEVIILIFLIIVIVKVNKDKRTNKRNNINKEDEKKDIIKDINPKDETKNIVKDINLEDETKDIIIKDIKKNYKLKELKPTEDSKYIARKLLTKNEKSFYNQIKNSIYERGLHIIAKIRLADLIEPKVNQYQNRSEWQTSFNKISAKHIDFAIINDNMEILFLIELDDITHNYYDRQERDEFVNISLVNAGYTLLRVYNNDEGISNITNYLEKNF